MAGLIDTGSSDTFMDHMCQKEAVDLIRSNKHNIEVRY